MLHQNVTARTLGFIRFWIFSIWFMVIVSDPFYLLSELPISIFEPIGFLRLFPENIWELLFDKYVLIIYKAVLLMFITLSIIGCRHYRFVAIVTVLLLTLHQGIVRGFGFVNHRELAILFSSYVLAIFPAGDGFLLYRKADDSEPQPIYSAGLLLITFLPLMCYTFIGSYRLCHAGTEIFQGTSLNYYLGYNSFRHSSFDFKFGIWFLQSSYLMTLMKTGYLVTTIFEILSPLCILYRRFRYVWLSIIIPFHFLSLLLMNIFFWENLVLFLVIMININNIISPETGVTKKDHPIIFYDGVCGLCNKFIDFILFIDHNRVFYYAPLQGKTAEKYNVTPNQTNPEIWSIVCFDEDGEFYKSDAAIKILSRIGGIFGFIKFFIYVPESARNWFYEFVAKHRYRLFGKLQSCRIPREEERPLMLP